LNFMNPDKYAEAEYELESWRGWPGA